MGGVESNPYLIIPLIEESTPMESLNQIKVVLVESAHPGNIGSAARAMKTMGIKDLALVNPSLFPCEQALWMASGAKDVLERAAVFTSLGDAVAECEFVIGTSARNRKIPWPVVGADECGQIVSRVVQSGKRVALVFGRESKGLTNEELQACNAHLSIPGSEEYDVLNLAMAVQIVCYEIRMHHLKLAKVPAAEASKKLMSVDYMTRWDEPLATSQEFSYFFEHLEQTLIDIGFLHPHHPKQILTRLNRLFTRTRMDKSELSLVRGILSAAQKLALVDGSARAAGEKTNGHIESP